MSATQTQVILISQTEAARLLSVERTTIWRMCGRGDLERVHIGRRALITMASVDAFVESQVQSLGHQHRR